MATLNFTIDEAMNILAANGMLPEAIKDIRAAAEGLLVTVSGNIGIQVRREAFSNGVLELTYGSSHWAFKLAASLGKVGSMLDEALRGLPFIRRENNSLFIDLNSALKNKIKGIQVKDVEFNGGFITITF